MTGRLAGKVGLVTGASRGIGLAIAQRLVREGVAVCVTARKPDELAQAVRELGGPDVALGVAGHAADAGHRRHAVTETIDRFGGLDLLVNNAAVNPAFGPLVDLDLEVARKVVDVNAVGALAWIQEAWQARMRDHGGAVVNVASVTGLRATPGIAFYGASKAMLLSLTESLAVELAPGVRVNAVAPGVVRTRFAAAMYDGREAEVASTYPLGRMGEPQDVAEAVAFLLSDAAAWVTGHTLVVDGGITRLGSVG